MSTTNLQSVVAPEMIIRDAIKTDIAKFVDNPDLVDDLFLKCYGETVTEEIKTFLTSRTGDGKFPMSIRVNWPKKGISLPHVGIILGNEQETKELDVLNNFIDVEFDEVAFNEDVLR